MVFSLTGLTVPVSGNEDNNYKYRDKVGQDGLEAVRDASTVASRFYESMNENIIQVNVYDAR